MLNYDVHVTTRKKDEEKEEFSGITSYGCRKNTSPLTKDTNLQEKGWYHRSVDINNEENGINLLFDI